MRKGKLKILIISQDNPFVAPSATNNRFLSIAEGLQLNGAELTTLIINKSIKSKNFKAEGVFRKIKYKHLLNNMPLILFYRYFFKRLKRLIAFLIYKEINKNDYDYVWLRFSEQVVSIGIILFDYNVSAKYYHEQGEYSWITIGRNSSIHRRYLMEFLPNINIMSLISETLIDYYRAYVSENTKLYHLPMTVDFSRFGKNDSRVSWTKPYIAYCGSLSNKKDGVDILIKAFINIMNRFPKLNLYIAGDLTPINDYLDQKELISKNNAHKRIVFCGQLDRQETVKLLTNSTVLAMARPSSEQANGGFPTKLGEYLATGVPVCATNVGEISNYLEDNNSIYFAEPDSVKSFELVLIRALTDANSAIVGKSGRAVAMRHFDKTAQSAKLYDFLVDNKEE